jgi:hypothetical protein
MPFERGQSAVLFSNLAVRLDESGNEAERVSNQPPALGFGPKCTAMYKHSFIDERKKLVRTIYKHCDLGIMVSKALARDDVDDQSATRLKGSSHHHGRNRILVKLQRSSDNGKNQ